VVAGAGLGRSTGGARLSIIAPAARSQVSPTTDATTAPHQALYRRWRAQTFGQIVGQQAVVETLRNAVRTDRVAHAILFVGPRGTGKTSLARILAKALNCTNLQDGDACDACDACTAIRDGATLDVIEIDAASNRGIADIKELRDRVNYAPSQLRRKVYILDEAHQITKDAWNALLKSLEEPPDFVVFMFASTHPQEFPPAILSRLQRYDVRRLTVAEIEGKLGRILAADNRTAEPTAVHLIARLAAGGMRDAESMLDQLLASSGDRLDETRVRDLLGLADGEAVRGFVAALVDGDPVAGIRILDELEDRGRDPRVFLDQVVEAVRADLVSTLSSGASPSHASRLANAARRLAGIDPNRAGTGGLRLQLELALFSDARPSQPSTTTAEAVTEREPALAKAPTPSQPAAVPVAARSVEASDKAASKTAPRTAAEPRPPKSEQAIPPKPAVAGPAANATPAPASAPPAPASVPPATGDLATLLGEWQSIVSSTRAATQAILRECWPLSVEGAVVTLGFPLEKDFLKEQADRRRPDLESTIGGVLNRAVNVRCVATNVVVAQPAGQDARLVLDEARRIFAEELVDVGEVS
jgi:DNA polymerase III subunit gamma/tau